MRYSKDKINLILLFKFMGDSEKTSYLTFNDYLSSYLNEATVDCFERCSKDLTKGLILPEEYECTKNCFAKYFLSYSNMSDLLEIKNLK